MIHFYKEDLKNAKKKHFVMDFFSALKTWIPLSVLCRSHEQEVCTSSFQPMRL